MPLSSTLGLRHVLATDLASKRQQTIRKVKREEGDFTSSLVLNKNALFPLDKEDRYGSINAAN
jgi:hypothetical protein